MLQPCVAELLAYPDPEYKAWPVLGNTTHRVDTLYVYIYLHVLSNQAISTCSQSFLSVFWSTGGMQNNALSCNKSHVALVVGW